MFPEWSWVLGLAIGASFGSFLNVVIYRLPRRISLAKPAHSFCPNCKTDLGVADLIPLLSWLFLGGKCRHCGAKIPPRYFLVELVNGGLYSYIWHLFLVADFDVARAALAAATASLLVAMLFIDWEFYIIPDELNALLWLVGVAFNAYLIAVGHEAAFLWGIPSSLAGWLVGTGVIWGISFLGRIAFQKDAMGHGDIKMARGIGAVLLPIGVLLTCGIAVFLGAVLGAVQVLVWRFSPESEHPEASSRQETGESTGEGLQYDEPESIGSLLRCGLAYAVCLDIVGLFFPKLYMRVFGEDPFTSVEDDEFEVERTMIPFGPYLAAGAIAVLLFKPQVMSWIDAYSQWAFGGS